MGVYNNSKSLRQYVISRNIYNPDNVYDINNNLLTQSLNTLQSVGFDARSSNVLNLIEGAVQNTPLVRVGRERLAVEFGRRAVDATANRLVQSVNIGALFDGDPSTKLFRKIQDYTITPSENANKFNFKNIGDKLLGINDFQNPLDKTGSAYAAGSIQYYVHLGLGQKDALEANVGQNFYSPFNFKNQFLNQDGTNTILRYTYSDLFISRNKNLDNDKVLGYIKGDTFSYIRDKNLKVVPTLISNDPVINDLNATLDNTDHIKNILEEEGFGKTDLRNINPDGTSYNNIYSEEDTFKYGDDLNKYGIERGLLYYTNQIANLKKNIKQETTEFKVNEDGTSLWKGASECRSFTVYKQYGEDQATLMRFEGNGDPNSVLNKTVIPRMHPIPSDFDTNGNYNDDTHFMFSIENLAYNPSEWKTLPYAERGPNGGRLMWFAPYGLNVTETGSANLDSERLIGRIEPIYTYAGAERVATITFMLIVDIPPNISSYEKWDLSKYFAGCDVSETIISDTSTIDNTNEVKKDSDINKVPVPSPSATRKDLDNTPLFYYFQNDVDRYESGYEIDSNGVTTNNKLNIYGLNKNYITNENIIKTFLRSKDGDDIQIIVEGNASKLAANDYNIKLSLRRAFNMAKRFVDDLGQSFDSFNDFLTSDLYLKSSVKDIGKSFTFNSTGEKKMTLLLKGFGEPNGTNESDNDVDLRRQVDSENSKKQRYCKISVSYLPNIAESTSKTNITPAPETIIDKNNTNVQLDGSNTSGNIKVDQGTNPFKKTYGEDGVGYESANGFDKIDYFTPAFHSQTPQDLIKRYIFLNQLLRPGSTIDKLSSGAVTNSIFGKAPSTIIRIGDFYHSRFLVRNIQFEMGDSITWDMNPEGFGMNPMIVNVTMDGILVGGQSMKFAVDRLQTAIDQNYLASSTFNPKGKYAKYYNPIANSRQSALDIETKQGNVFKANKMARNNT